MKVWNNLKPFYVLFVLWNCNFNVRFRRGPSLKLLSGSRVSANMELSIKLYQVHDQRKSKEFDIVSRIQVHISDRSLSGKMKLPLV